MTTAPASDRPRIRQVGRSYTRGRRQPYLIRKWPGSNTTLPLGPYTLSQLVILVGTTYLLVTYMDYWTFFGPMNVVIGVGLPIGLTFAARHSRIEGRDPLRAAAAGFTFLTQSRTGYVQGEPWRTPRPMKVHSRRFPVAYELPYVAPEPVAAPPPPQPPQPPPVSATVLALAGRRGVRTGVR